jgi:hypothetical protein
LSGLGEALLVDLDAEAERREAERSAALEVSEAQSR